MTAYLIPEIRDQHREKVTRIVDKFKLQIPPEVRKQVLHELTYIQNDAFLRGAQRAVEIQQGEAKK